MLLEGSNIDYVKLWHFFMKRHQRWWRLFVNKDPQLHATKSWRIQNHDGHDIKKGHKQKDWLKSQENIGAGGIRCVNLYNSILSNIMYM